MNKKEYLKQIIIDESKKIRFNGYIRKLIREEYNKLKKESAGDIRDTLDDLDYEEKGSELDNGGPMQSHATELFTEFFEFLKAELPDVKIKVTGGNDKFHKGYYSRHIFGEAIDFTVVKGQRGEVWKVLQKFKRANPRDFKCLDEYTNPTEHSTGGHFHIAYIGTDSLYDKAKRDGSLPDIVGAGTTFKYKSGQGINVADFNSINKWEGTDENGTSLEAIDNHLYKLSQESKSSQGTFIKLVAMNAEGQGKKIASHKWEVRAKLRVPPKSEDEGGVQTQGVKPDEEGILPSAPETITFYPSGNLYMYNSDVGGGYASNDIELEPASK